MDVALAGRSRAGDVQLLVVVREAQAVGVRHLVVGDHHIDAAARVPSIDLGGQLLLRIADPDGLADPVVEPALRVALAAGRIGGAFVELGAVGRVGEPDAAVRMRDRVVGRVEPLAVPGVGEHRDRAVELVADDAPGEVLAGDLPALEVEGVAVAVVRRHAEDGDVAVVLDPAQSAGCSGCRSRPGTCRPSSRPGPRPRARRDPTAAGSERSAAPGR